MLLDRYITRQFLKAIFFGHTHVWERVKYEGIHLVNLPPVAYVFQAGEPSGWVHARLERNGIELELRCVDPTHKSHGRPVKLQWRAS